MSAQLPPDHCDEQVGDCCCNSIAFTLSMLCLNCQQGVRRNDGFDAAPGTYQRYLRKSTEEGSPTCSPARNRILPAVVQRGVCNEDIKLLNSFYGEGPFWEDGAWFYVFTSQSATLTLNANPDAIYGQCSLRSNGTSTTTITTTTDIGSSPIESSFASPEPQSASRNNTPRIAGGIVGGIIALLGVLFLVLWALRRRSRGAGGGGGTGVVRKG